MGKTISELIEKTSVNDSDVLLIEDNVSTNKITKENFLKEITEKLNSEINKTDILSDRVEAVEKLKEGTELSVSTESGYVVCEDTNNGQIEGLKVEGNTLVNLVKETSFAFSSNYPNIHINKDLIKPNTKYTYILVGNNTSNISSVYCGSSDDTEILLPRTYNKLKGTFISPNISITKDIRFICYHSGTAFTEEQVNSFKLLILEGDFTSHTQNPPSYFEGLKSVGDNTDKIEVLSCGKNLCNPSDLLINSSLDASGNVSVYNGRAVSGYCTVKSSMPCFLSGNGSGIWYYCEYDENRQIIGSRLSTDTGKFITSSKTKFIRFFRHAISSTTLTSVDEVKMQLEIGGTATEYLPFVGENKKQILFKNSSGVYEKPVLRSTGAVSDTIEKHSDGKYYYHKRCGEVVLNGSESWGSASEGDNINGISMYTSFPKVKRDTKCVSDKLKNVTWNDNHQSKVDFVLIGNSTFVINLPRTKLSTQDVQGFKTWLQANPVTVVYQLATEEVYEVVNLDLDSYEGETSVIVYGGAISPKLSFKIASHIANTVQVLKDRINYLEDKVINMFKAVLCGDVQTLAYELYPEDFKETIEETEIIEN